MKSIQTRVVLMISIIIILAVSTLLGFVAIGTTDMINQDSDEILLDVAEYYANSIDDNFDSTEQSVGTIYNYAIKKIDSYSDFLGDDIQREEYTNDISELSESIAENTIGAMAVYLRYNPDEFGGTEGFWYTINVKNGNWVAAKPTDMTQYDPTDLEHVGWYYIPVSEEEPNWMAPYFNANLGVDMISYIIPYFYDDKTVGIIGMDISIDAIRNAVSNIQAYETGKAFALERDGSIIYHPDYPNGKLLSDMTDEEKEFFTGILDNDFNKALIVNDHGKNVKLVLRELKNGMILGVYAPVEEISLPRTMLLSRFLLVFVIIVAASILLASFSIRRFVKPIKTMTEVAREYAEGNFSKTITVRGNDEIGVLSHSLQAMSESLQAQVFVADAANRAKGDFLANMSHEVRTPINAILGMDEMIIRESDDKQIVEYATNIKQAGKSLLAQVNGILDYSKLEDGKMDIIPVEYDLATLINTIVSTCSARTKAKGLKLNVDVDEKLPAMLIGDDVRVSQVINNLMTNAIKYTDKGQISLTVKEQSRTEDSVDIAVSIKDTGIGIKSEDMGKLAISFKRVDEERNRNIEGTGLGIPIVIKILNLMDSQLNVESVYNEGSCFSFVLRQQIAGDEEIGDYRKRAKKKNRRRNRYTYPSMPEASILLVDDYEMNLVVAKNLMKIYDFVPDLVTSGREAITRIEEKKYDIIFMDHMMPGMDGIETMEILKKNNLLGEKTAIIALTANAIAGAKEYYISKGFNDYLTKPIDPEALEDVLLKYIPKKKVINKPISDLKSDKSLVNNDERQALLKIFVSTIDDTAKQLDELVNAKDIKNYTIKVHGLKSTARLIGEMSISTKAEKLEKAGKAEDWEYILRHHDELIKEYRSVRDNFGAEEKPKKKLEDSDLKDALYSIIEMASVCDYSSTDMLLNSLDEYDMPKDIADKMQDIRFLLDKLDYDGVVAAAKKML